MEPAVARTTLELKGSAHPALSHTPERFNAAAVLMIAPTFAGS